MRTSICALVLVVGAMVTSTAAAQENKLNQPPAGFIAVFNGQDLAGWYGMESVSPDAIAALTAEERAKKKATDTEAAFKHWRVEKGELVNDGFGPYLTTEKDYGDIELMIDYKTVPKADSGIYLAARLRCKSGISPNKKSSASVPIKVPAGSGTTRPVRPAKIPWSRRQTVRRVEPVPDPADRRTNHRLSQ